MDTISRQTFALDMLLIAAANGIMKLIHMQQALSKKTQPLGISALDIPAAAHQDDRIIVCSIAYATLSLLLSLHLRHGFSTL